MKTPWTRIALALLMAGPVCIALVELDYSWRWHATDLDLSNPLHDQFSDAVRCHVAGSSQGVAFNRLNGNPLVFCSIGAFNCQLVLPLQADDIAVLQGYNGLNKDAVLVANSGGIKACTWNVTTSQFDVDNIAGGVVRNATALEVMDLDGDGDEDIIVLAADQRTLYKLDGQGTGSFAAPTVFATTLVTAHDVAKVHWSSDTSVEVGVRETSLFEVYNAAGMRVDGAALPASAFRMVPFRSAVRAGLGEGDRLGFLCDDSPQTLVLHDSEGLVQTVSLGHNDLIHCNALDSNHDGEDDFWASSTATRHLYRQYLDSDGQPIGSLTPKALTLGFEDPETAMPDNRAQPGAGDLDGDGDVDLAFPCGALNRLTVLFNDSVNEKAQRPQLLYGAPIAINEDDVLQVPLNLGAAPGANSTRYRIWSRAGIGGAVDPVPYMQGETSQVSGSLQLDVDLTSIWSDWKDGSHILMFEVRHEQVDGQGNVIHAFASFTMAASGHAPTNEYFASLPYTGDLIAIEDPMQLGTSGSTPDTPIFPTGLPPTP